MKLVSKVMEKFRIFIDKKKGNSARGDLQIKENRPDSEVPEFGLHIFHSQPADREDAIDIVALHGLRGHYKESWSTTDAQNVKVNWLDTPEFLPYAVPNARIMSYSYNSAVIFSKSVATISNFADGLLEDLMTVRSSEAEKKRPIIFICHSMGSLVFKQVC
jgi:hypothetical protein